MTESTFRGINGIREIKERMTPLVNWYQKFRPDVKTLMLKRKDFDLIRRWPNAASVEGFTVTDNGLFYSGFTLTPAKGEGRYES